MELEKEALNLMSTLKEQLDHSEKLIASTKNGVKTLGQNLEMVVEPLTGRSLPPVPAEGSDKSPALQSPPKLPDLRMVIRRLETQVISLQIIQREIQNLKEYEQDFRRVIYGSEETVGEEEEVYQV